MGELHNVIIKIVIFDVVFNLAKNVVNTKRTLYIGMMVVAFIATYLLDISAMVVILTCLGIGLIDLAVKNVVNTKRTLYIGMMVVAFIATYLLDISAMVVILTCLGIGLIDLAVTTWNTRRAKNGGIA